MRKAHITELNCPECGLNLRYELISYKMSDLIFEIILQDVILLLFLIVKQRDNIQPSVGTSQRDSVIGARNRRFWSIFEWPADSGEKRVGSSFMPMRGRKAGFLPMRGKKYGISQFKSGDNYYNPFVSETGAQNEATDDDDYELEKRAFHAMRGKKWRTEPDKRAQGFFGMRG